MGRTTVAADPDSSVADEKALQAAKIATDAPALLDFFRKRTLADADRAIALNGRSASAFSTRGLIRERLADNAGAIADFRKALELDPTFQQPAEGLRRLKAGPAAGR